MSSDPHPSSESHEDEFLVRLAMLSHRELTVLELAVAGRTDAQIAQALDLAPSTVNSYWVRIRGKLGQLSRTEIATVFVRHQSLVESRELRAENERLKDELSRATERFEELRKVYQSFTEVEWPLRALMHAPEATLVTAPPARVVFANRQAGRLYRAPASELEGLPMGDLTAAGTAEAAREPCRELFREGGPETETVGIKEPYFARRRDGSNFRAVVQASRFHLSDSPLAVVTVREFLGDAAAILELLRQPLPED